MTHDQQALKLGLVNQTAPTHTTVFTCIHFYPRVNKLCGGSGLVHETSPLCFYEHMDDSMFLSLVEFTYSMIGYYNAASSVGITGPLTGFFFPA